MPSITPSNLTAPAAPQAQTSAVEATRELPQQLGAEEASVAAETKPAPADPLSPKFAALAREQKLLRQQQREIQEQRKAIEAERQTIEQSKQWKQRITQDPYGVMLEAGLTADQVAALMLQQPNPEEQKYSLLQQELKQIKESQEQAKQEALRIQQQQYADAVGQIRSDVESLVSADDTYETIKTMGATEAVVALIEETYHKDKRLMSIDEAAKEVEEYLVEEAYKIAQIKKIRAKFNPAPEQQDPLKQLSNQKSLQQQPAQSKQQMTTLSNRALNSSAKPMTNKERRERAILAFQGKLT